MVAAGQTTYSDALAEAAAAVYAPALGPPIPHAAATPVVFDGPAFFAKRHSILPCGARKTGAPAHDLYAAQAAQ